ncbi:MAG: Rieske (2Fe-2S) protein [Actinobacteria bacterium]|nr:Rieske (2Fe-2S) protein [Actinomycetota bacterium]
MTSHHLGPVAAIPIGEGRAFTASGQQIAVFRLRNGALRAMDAVCPHAGGPLADGQTDHAKVVCPLHGYAFSVVDGSCPGGDFSVRVHRVREENGELIVDLC